MCIINLQTLPWFARNDYVPSAMTSSPLASQLPVNKPSNFTFSAMSLSYRITAIEREKTGYRTRGCV